MKFVLVLEFAQATIRNRNSQESGQNLWSILWKISIKMISHRIAELRHANFSTCKKINCSLKNVPILLSRYDLVETPNQLLYFCNTRGRVSKRSVPMGFVLHFTISLVLTTGSQTQSIRREFMITCLQNFYLAAMGVATTFFILSN